MGLPPGYTKVNPHLSDLAGYAFSRDEDSAEKYASSWLGAVDYYDALCKPPYTFFQEGRDIVEMPEDEFEGETTNGHPEYYRDVHVLATNYNSWKRCKRRFPPNGYWNSMSSKGGSLSVSSWIFPFQMNPFPILTIP